MSGDVDNPSISAITLTDTAAAKVAELAAKEDVQSAMLRFSVEGGGCGGFQYGLGFVAADQVDDEDFRFAYGDVIVVVDPFSMPYVKGATIDFTDGLRDSGFKIENPNASGSCGCGQSFTADGSAGVEDGHGCASGCGDH